MLSVIVCSISPDNLTELSKNIKETAGVPVEIIGIDNRELKWPISKVYNHAASQARYENLLFVHEDVLFHSRDWGKVIIEKLSDPQCGVIGFAGSKVMRKVYSGWYQSSHWQCMMLYQGAPGMQTRYLVRGVTLENKFEEVVTLDGMAMFMRKNLWDSYHFDEENLKGFHCYDVDLTLSVASDGLYRNYVCATPEVLVEHRSMGNFAESWFDETINMFHLKWKQKLPLHVEGYNLKSVRRCERKARSFFLKNAFKCAYKHRWRLLLEYLFPLK
jgi:hypothetical protein